ncbi:MAG: divalent-cation tolerance protein CutA [Actinomycetota bacterium]
MGTDICEVIVTSDDAEWLTGLTRTLVEERLVACGQHVTQVRSIYRWQGAVEEAIEARVALHTRSDLVGRVIERVRQEHAYDVPCVIALPVLDGNPAYLEWVRTETT